MEVAEETVEPIANELWFDGLESEGFRIEKDPHVTLVPGYDADAIPNLPDFTEPQPVEVSGIRCWPDIERPMVVMLDVSDDMLLNVWRDEILAQIGKTTVEYDVAPPHVKLFKAGNSGDEQDFAMDASVRNELIERVDNVKTPSRIAITDIVRTSWEV